MAAEDDYMSMSFVVEEKPKRGKRRRPVPGGGGGGKAKKLAATSTKNRKKKPPPPKPPSMAARRDEGLATAISSTNIGFKMLAKMGYAGKGGLGKEGNKGQAEPVGIAIRPPSCKEGLGEETRKREAEARASAAAVAAARGRTERAAAQEQTFRQQRARQFEQRQAWGDLGRARATTKTLDEAACIPRHRMWPYDAAWAAAEAEAAAAAVAVAAGGGVRRRRFQEEAGDEGTGEGACLANPSAVAKLNALLNAIDGDENAIDIDDDEGGGGGDGVRGGDGAGMVTTVTKMNALLNAIDGDENEIDIDIDDDDDDDDDDKDDKEGGSRSDGEGGDNREGGGMGGDDEGECKRIVGGACGGDGGSGGATMLTANTDADVQAAAQLFRAMLDETTAAYTATEPLGQALREARSRVFFFLDPGSETVAQLPPRSQIVLRYGASSAAAGGKGGGEGGGGSGGRTLVAAARWTVLENERVVPSGAQSPAEAPCELNALFTAPSHRGLGHGRALLRAVLAKARGAGCTTMSLSTGDRLSSAMRLYEREGFVRKAGAGAGDIKGDVTFERKLCGELSDEPSGCLQEETKKVNEEGEGGDLEEDTMPAMPLAEASPAPLQSKEMELPPPSLSSSSSSSSSFFVSASSSLAPSLFSSSPSSLSLDPSLAPPPLPSSLPSSLDPPSLPPVLNADAWEMVDARDRVVEVTGYLRRTHFYCLFCGVTFGDAKDMAASCPGLTRDDH